MGGLKIIQSLRLVSIACFLIQPTRFGIPCLIHFLELVTLKFYNSRQQIAKFKQGALPLSIYYPSLQKMWEELKHYTTYRPSCAKDSTAYKKHEEIQTFEFLVGLNSEYEQVRVNLLGNDPLPL